MFLVVLLAAKTNLEKLPVKQDVQEMSEREMSESVILVAGTSSVLLFSFGSL